MNFVDRDAHQTRMRANLSPVQYARSSQGEWKHNRYDFASRRHAAKVFGRMLARVDRTNPAHLAAFAVHVEQSNGVLSATREMWRYDMTNMLTKFAPDMGQMLQRERSKFSTGEWDSVPWVGMTWWEMSPYKYLHGVHMSTSNPGNIAYAESGVKREAGRYTSTKAGRYLTKYFGDKLDEKQIKLWAEKCAASAVPLTLRFIESNNPAGWVEVYHDGPDSCMSGESSECVGVYAHDKSVLRLAYVERGEAGILGRCIVREDTTPKQYIRVYPTKPSLPTAPHPTRPWRT